MQSQFLSPNSCTFTFALFCISNSALIKPDAFLLDGNTFELLEGVGGINIALMLVISDANH